jgi:hypothetical protein
MKQGILNTNVDLVVDLADVTAKQSFPLHTAQTFSADPKGYRLVRETTGELTLQGAYSWWGAASAGFEWRDIATVNREDLDENTPTT